MMKAVTLTNYINHKVATDVKFSECYHHKCIINAIVEMIVTYR